MSTTARPSTAPVVTSVTFRTTATPADDTPAHRFANGLLTRTVAHLDRVRTGDIISSFLAEYPPTGDASPEILRLTALVETVLDEARTAVRTGMAMDLASRLIPRLTQGEKRDER